MQTREPNPYPREDLVGYLLGALDEPAHREVETQLQASPEASRTLDRLRAAFAPLESDRDEIAPPANLVANTLALVAGHSRDTLPPAPRLSRNQGSPRSWWRRSDVLVASVLLFILLGVGASWFARSWHRNQITACQDNLRLFHEALTLYADQRQDGAFPRVEPEGPRAFAGVFIPVLADAGVLSDKASLNCPARGDTALAREPGQVRQLEVWYQKDRPRYDQAVASLAGSYAYSLGYRDRGNLQGLRRGAGMDNYPIMADCPPFSSKDTAHDGNSHDHGGSGQNVLMIDGSVRFVTSRVVAGDDIYLNDHRLLAAGIREDDCVLGYSDAAP